MKKTKTIYMCENCGNEFSSWSGKCSVCGEWNSLKEVSFSQEISNGSTKDKEMNFTKLSSVKIKNSKRIKTDIGEFDRVLGGGIVPGSVILLGGEPGIGKSTILMQVSNSVKRCFYLSAEESLPQIKLRADRLKINSGKIELLTEGNIELLEREIKKNKPDLLIIDSIQTVFLGSLSSTPGSLVQVRECGIFLQRLAKSTGTPIVIIGHVTKDGSLAGPRMLEHLVDVVLYIEGEKFHDARILRGIKNRFGATNETGIFSLQERGMVEIKNPSELFLSEKQNESGSAVAASLEGTRPILVEIQALVMLTRFGYPKRTASGFDLNRLNLLAAVISKKTIINLGNYDIYINIVGGMKLRDPAIDLAVCMAMISSVKNKSLPEKLCFIGEIGLSGEIRKVNRQKERQKEAVSLGYKVIKNSQNLSTLMQKLKI